MAAGYLRPRRGMRASAINNNVVLQEGEVFFETPDSGVGTGSGKIKMGDGVTEYSELPYFAGGVTSDVTNVEHATKATKDENGKNITSYIASVGFAEGKIVVTNGLNDKSEFALNDATSALAGVTKLYNNTGEGTDGTMTQAAISSAISAVDSNHYTKSETYTKSEIDNALSVTSDGVVSSVSMSGSTITVTKAGQDTTYTVPDATSAVAGIMKLYGASGEGTDGTMTQGAITSALSTLKTNLEAKIGQINSFDMVKVNELPAVAEASDHTIYFVPTADTTDDNVCDEYVVMSGAWEIIGTTKTDLSNYYNKTEVDSAITTAKNGTVTGVTQSGNTFTVTKGDGTSSDLTIQSASGTVAGVAKLYSTSGSATDGSMTQAAIGSAITTAKNGTVTGVSFADSTLTVAKGDGTSTEYEIKVSAESTTTTTLVAANWSSGVYSFESTYPVASYNISIEPNYTCTAAQMKAWGAAMLCGDAAANSLHVGAGGTIPTIDIPVIIHYSEK